MKKQKDTIHGSRKRLYIYLKPSEKEKLRELAKRQDISMSAYVVKTLEDHLNKIITLDL